MKEKYGDINVTLLDDFVAQCEIDRPPNNFFDLNLIRDMADCFDDLDGTQIVELSCYVPTVNTFVREQILLLQIRLLRGCLSSRVRRSKESYISGSS